MLFYQSQILQTEGPSFIGFPIHPDYPFASIFQWHCRKPFSANQLYFYWYLLELYSFCTIFEIQPLLRWLNSHSPDDPFHLFLTQFRTIPQWKEMVNNAIPSPAYLRHPQYLSVVFQRSSISLRQHFHLVNNCHVYDTLPYSLAEFWELYPAEYRELQRKLFELNAVIPKEIWPAIQDEVPWEHYSHDYQCSIDTDFQIYKEAHPDVFGTPDPTPPQPSPPAQTPPPAKDKGKAPMKSPPQKQKAQATQSSQPSRFPPATRDSELPGYAQSPHDDDDDDNSLSTFPDDSDDPDYCPYEPYETPWWKQLGYPTDPYDPNQPAPQSDPRTSPASEDPDPF